MKRTQPLFHRCLALAAILTLSLAVKAQTSSIPHTLLWRITGKELKKPSYLYGTMHLNDQRLFQFGDSVYRAIESSDGLAIEVSPDEMAAYYVNRLFDQVQNGKKLEDILDPAYFERHKKELAERFNKPAEDIKASDVVKEKNKWMQEYMEKGEMPTFVDAYLYNIARRQGKWLGGIEDIGDQANLLDDLVDQSDVNYLLESGKTKTGKEAGQSKAPPMLEKMIDVYTAQDLDQLQAVMNMQSSPEQKDLLLIRRNVKMARRMDSLASLRTMFFAVGAAHLPGDSGVIDLLRKRGFTVEPVFSQKKLAASAYTFKEVRLPWTTVSGEDSSYVVQMPANPASVRLYGLIEMKFLLDLFNMAGYCTSAVMNTGHSVPDSTFHVMSRRMFDGKDVVPVKMLEKNGISGREYIYSRPQSHIRVQLFVDDKMLYLAILSCMKKDMLTSADADKFFQSFTINTQSKMTVNTMAYTDSVMGVSFKTPTNLVYNEKLSRKDDAWKVSCFSGVDRATGSMVLLFSKEIKPAYHIANIGQVYGDYTDRFTKGYAHLQQDSLFIDSVKFMGYRGQDNENTGLFMNALTAVKDGRQVVLMVLSDSTGQESQVLKEVSQSFRFIPHSRQPWGAYEGPDHAFRFYGPSPVRRHASSDNENDNNNVQWVSYDTTTATSYLIWPDTLGKYTWYLSDSAFWKSNLPADTTEHELLYMKDVDNGGVRGKEILTRDKKEPLRLYRNRLLVSGNKLYRLITYGSWSLVTSPDVNKFYDGFRLNGTVEAPDVTRNKTAELLKDLASNDSATIWHAYLAIRDAPFRKNDAPLLRQALFTRYKSPYDTGYAATINQSLAHELALLHDSATVDFIRDAYPGLVGEKAGVKNVALGLLAEDHTDYSYAALSSLLKQGPTTAALNDDFQSSVLDSLSLGARLLPSLLGWTKDTLQTPGIAYITLRLVDSGFLSKDSLRAIGGNFISCAAALLPGVRSTGKYTDGDILYLLRLIGNIRTSSATTVLRNYLAIKNNFLLKEVVLQLIDRQQAIPPAVMLRIAKDINYRADLYSDLKKKKKAALFPVEYRTAALLGQSLIYGSVNDNDDDEAVDTVTYLSRRTASYNGKSYVFYLYKVKYEAYEDEPATVRLGIAGGYDVVGGGVLPVEELTGVYYKEGFDEKKVGEQLKDYLKSREEDSSEENE